MSKIIITGNEPLTFNTMCYFKLDVNKEKKLQFNSQPYTYNVDCGEHYIALNTISPFRRNLSALGGATIGSQILDSMTDDSWEGTVTLNEDNDVLFVYVESKFKTEIHLSVIKENEVEEKLALVKADDNKGGNGKKILNILLVLFILGISVVLINNFINNNKIVDTDNYTEPTEIITTEQETTIITTEKISETEIVTEAYTEEQNIDYSSIETKYITEECYLYDSPNGNKTSYIMLKGDGVKVLETSNGWSKVLNNYYECSDFNEESGLEFKSAEGWMKTENLSDDFISNDYLLKGELTKNKAQLVINNYHVYLGYPYYYFEKSGKLDNSQSYDIFWENGELATTAYAADGINTVEDIISAASFCCSKNMIETSIRSHFTDGHGHFIDEDNKLYFYQNYASGYNSYYVTDLIKNEDESYLVKCALEFTDDDFNFKMIKENGIWKVDSFSND